MSQDQSYRHFAEIMPGQSLTTKLCPVCFGNRVHYAFSCQGDRVLQCSECNFTFNTSPDASHPEGNGGETAINRSAQLGGLAEIVSQIIPGKSFSDEEIRAVNWHSDGRVVLAPRASECNVVLSVGQLDASNDPLPMLKQLWAQLSPSDTAVFVYRDIRRAGVAIGSLEWEQMTGRRHAYLDAHTALTILHRSGFRCQGVRRLRRRVSLQQLIENEGNHLVNGRLDRLFRLLPKPLRRVIRMNALSADVAILAVPRPADAPEISVVVPVYNEAPTLAKLLDQVLRVEFQDARVEVIIVESNSTDGSKEIVQGYASHPRVTCLFEDRPRGKGHATRLGLARAKGDVIIIQDADLEYDIEDYHGLIDPILSGHAAFVLGSRHGGRNHWKLRQFGKPLLSKFYNLAHVLVTAYINIFFGLNLRDPQTMYKVCRRDCIEGLTFYGAYFNFDYELLLKIVRKGYKPIEIPVNYRSRSHAEGKKIRMWRDAPLGLLMITKLRFTPLRRFLGIGDPIE
jgi:hypothetical protein